MTQLTPNGQQQQRLLPYSRSLYYGGEAQSLLPAQKRALPSVALACGVAILLAAAVFLADTTSEQQSSLLATTVRPGAPTTALNRQATRPVQANVLGRQRRVALGSEVERLASTRAFDTPLSKSSRASIQTRAAALDEPEPEPEPESESNSEFEQKQWSARLGLLGGVLGMCGIVSAIAAKKVRAAEASMADATMMTADVAAGTHPSYAMGAISNQTITRESSLDDLLNGSPLDSTEEDDEFNNTSPLDSTEASGSWDEPFNQSRRPYGSGQEILLQGFNWESHKAGNWYQIMADQAPALAEMGITAVWFPPPTDSVAPQGYMPRDLYCLDSKYGTMDDLKMAIETMQSHGIQCVADIVINHRCAHYQNNHGIWNKFGGKLDWGPDAIVGNDPNYHGHGHNRSEGDFFWAAPNVCHEQEFVRLDIIEWLQWLRNEVGFDGWRFDYTKGYGARFVGDYVAASHPSMSVSEYWTTCNYDGGKIAYDQNSHRQSCVDWINRCQGRSTAFDFTTKGILHEACGTREYWRLIDNQGKPSGLLGWWPSRSVTFLENHDTGSTQGHWSFPGHREQEGYAYILTHPGTPSIFWDHLQNDHIKQAIKDLVAVRRRNNIHCKSQVKILKAENNVYAAEIDGKIVMKMGPGDWSPGKNWEISCWGQDWAVWEQTPYLP